MTTIQVGTHVLYRTHDGDIKHGLVIQYSDSEKYVCIGYLWFDVENLEILDTITDNIDVLPF